MWPAGCFSEKETPFSAIATMGSEKKGPRKIKKTACKGRRKSVQLTMLPRRDQANSSEKEKKKTMKTGEGDKRSKHDPQGYRFPKISQKKGKRD